MSFVSPLGDYIDGRWLVPSAPDAVIRRDSPANTSDRIGEFPIAYGHVDMAVAAAREAQPGWEATPLSERLEVVRRFGAELRAREADFVELLGREVGKPAWEAKTEVAALSAKIEITASEGLALVRDYDIDGGKFSARFLPLGVLAVLGPFNFPLHLPNGHVIPALLTGNTVVFKPSELTPGCAQVYLQAADAARLPPGVLNLVQGDARTGADLSSHADIDGVLFTGSSAAGRAITEANIERPGRMIALEMGGKNAAVVLADAPFEKAVYDVVYSGCVTAGQRCTAVSRVVVERSIAGRFVDALSLRAKNLKVGRPTSPDTFMGPLVSEAAFEKFQAAQRAAESETQVVVASREVDVGVRGYYVSPAVHRVAAVDATSRYQREELFGPDLAVYVADDAEHAAFIANATDYGLAAAVFTKSEASFEWMARRLRVGVLAWNAPSVGSSSRLPFGGLRRSGNLRPAGLFSSLYCVRSLAISRGGVDLDTEKLPPGTRW